MTSVVELKIGKVTGAPGEVVSDMSVKHKPGLNDSDPLCWYAVGRYGRAGEMWFLARRAQPVTCPECLEWMHA